MELSKKGYKIELQQAVLNRLQQFLQEEVGNRVTQNNMTGLSISLNIIFEQHLIKNKDKNKPT